MGVEVKVFRNKKYIIWHFGNVVIKTPILGKKTIKDIRFV